MAVVYQHIRLDNNQVFYVGIGSEKRAYAKNDRNDRWYNIVNKHGYDVEVLYFDLPWEAACQIEKHLIKTYGRADLGKGSLVNMTDGGDGVPGRFGTIHTDESKEKIRQAQLGRIKSQEEIEKTLISRKWYKHSKESKEKMSNSKKGKPKSEEHKVKLSAAAKRGVNNHWSKKVVCKKTGVIFDSITEICKKTGMHHATLSHKLNGIRKNDTDFEFLNCSK